MSNTFLYRKAYATCTILALNVLIFLVMATQGGSRAREIYRGLAVVVPQDFRSLEWGKLLTANFVHQNLAHLVVNMVLLCVLGTFVEFVLGIKKYVLIYLASGIVGMFMLNVYAAIFDLYVPSLRVVEPQISAGASACVMGLLGARAAILLRMWRNVGSGIARNHFLFVVLTILLQVAVDMSALTVSFGAHVTGAFVGFVLALLMKHAQVDLSTANPFNLAGAAKQR